MKFHSQVVTFLVSTAVAGTFVSANSAGGPGGFASQSGYNYQQQPGQQQWNSESGQLSYEQPEQDQVEEKDPEEQPPLPPGWSEHFDPNSGQYYYFNTTDGTTTWDRPPPDPSQLVEDAEQVEAPQPEAMCEPTMQERESPQATTGYKVEESYDAERNTMGQQESPKPQGFEQQTSWGAREEPKTVEPSIEEAPQQSGGWGSQYEPPQQLQLSNPSEETPQQQGWDEREFQPKPWETPDSRPAQSDGMAQGGPGGMGSPIEPQQQTPLQQTSGWGAPKEEEIPQQQPPQQAGWSSPKPAETPGQPQQQQGWSAPKMDELRKPEQQTQQPAGWGVAKAEDRPQQPAGWGVAKPAEQQQQPPKADEARLGPPTGQWGSPAAGGPAASKPLTQQQPLQPRTYGGQPQQQMQQGGQSGQQRPPTGQSAPQPHKPTQQLQPPQQQPAYGQSNPYGQGQPQRYGQYGQYGGQYGQYGSQQPGYSQQQQPQDGQVQKPLEDGSSAVKEAVGKSWQGIVGLGNRTREVMGQARDQVVTGATSAGQSLSAKSTTMFGQAKNALGSVFEGGNQNQGQAPEAYSMSGSYGTQAPAGGRPPQGYPQQGQQPPQGYPQQGQQPPQGYPQQQGQPPRYGGPPQGGSQRGGPGGAYGGRPPMQPRSDAPNPQQGGPPQQRGPTQSQYGGGYPPQQRGGYPPRQGGPASQGPQGKSPYGGPQGGPQQQQRPPQQAQEQKRPNPWDHPGLMGGD